MTRYAIQNQSHLNQTRYAESYNSTQHKKIIKNANNTYTPSISRSEGLYIIFD